MPLKIKKFKQISPTPGDKRGWSPWQYPASTYMLECCDCGLVHEMQFRVHVVKGSYVMKYRCRRAKRYTARARQRKDLKCHSNSKN